ncbi:MAG: hypothetical protein AB7S38_40215 [Vulcanimicrobiota bacterium]
MGLEITGFSKTRLLAAEEVTDFALYPLKETWENDRFALVPVPAGTPQAQGLVSGRYACENAWQILIGPYVRLERLQQELRECADFTDDVPDFAELYTAGRNTVFSTTVCAKLKRDFRKYSLYFFKKRNRFYDLYCEFGECFVFGADDGLVVFH